jgi:hypothetical protein
MSAGEFVLKLEGCLLGAWVKELEACWRDATATLDGRRVWADLTDVHSVDEAGRQLLALMHRAGVRFMTRGCFMPELVREIAESAEGVSR